MTFPSPVHLLSPASAVVAVSWAAFTIAWIVSARHEAAAPAQPRVQRRAGPRLTAALPGLLITALAFVLAPGGLWRHLQFANPWAHVLGLAVLASATTFTLWARLTLGTMWSAVPAVRQGHQLRTTGPYAVTRHPIYTGVLAMILGSGLVLGEGAWIVPLTVFLVLFQLKIRTEEAFMLATFPDEYPRYRNTVPQLIPGLRPPRRP